MFFYLVFSEIDVGWLKTGNLTNVACLLWWPILNTFAASYLNTQGLNNSCLKSPASTLVDLTFQ